uniref:Uncharacterized protein n=1 Tax=Oreochromis aureus TaxID=47969 RepID=A0AAZ1XJE3_OREAU
HPSCRTSISGVAVRVTVSSVQLTIKANLCMTCRSRYFLQVAKRLSLSSSFPTGGIRMRPQVPVSRFPLMPPPYTQTKPWRRSTAWWTMARAKSRSGVLRMVQMCPWIPPPMVTSMGETVTSSSTATDRDHGSSTSYTHGG